MEGAEPAFGELDLHVEVSMDWASPLQCGHSFLHFFCLSNRKVCVHLGRGKGCFHSQCEVRRKVTLPFLKNETNSSVEKGVSPMPTSKHPSLLPPSPMPAPWVFSSSEVRTGEQLEAIHTIFRERMTHRGVYVWWKGAQHGSECRYECP